MCHISLFRFKIFDGERTVIDTGVLHDKTYAGGRIGVMSFSQEKVSWSKIFYRCNGKARVRLSSYTTNNYCLNTGLNSQFLSPDE